MEICSDVLLGTGAAWSSLKLTFRKNTVEQQSRQLTSLAHGETMEFLPARGVDNDISFKGDTLVVSTAFASRQPTSAMYSFHVDNTIKTTYIALQHLQPAAAQAARLHDMAWRQRALIRHGCVGGSS